MEIACANKCGNLTDSPNYNKCSLCRELELMDSILKYKVTWDDGKVTFLNLTPTQAQNLKQTSLVKSVVLVG